MRAVVVAPFDDDVAFEIVRSDVLARFVDEGCPFVAVVGDLCTRADSDREEAHTQCAHGDDGSPLPSLIFMASKPA